MPDFELITPYKAAGAQVKAIQKITNSFLKGKDKVTLVGVTGSGKTFTMAEVIRNVKRPTLVLSPS